MEKKQHSLRIFDDALIRYKRQVWQLFDGALSALELSCRALVENNSDLANRVIADDDALDDLHRDINNRCMTILASFSPVSVDLKFVLSLLKLAGMFERLGDYACQIAAHCLKLDKLGDNADREMVVPVFESVLRHLSKIRQAFESGDTDLVKEYLVIHEDREGFVSSLTESLTMKSERDGACIPALAELIFIARALEYVWDYLQRIEEEVLHLPYH